MPLYNDKPETAGGTARDLVERQRQGWNSAPNVRKREAGNRLKVLNGLHRDLIAARVEETHHDPRIRGRIKKFIELGVNPAADITRALACVYKQGVRREIKNAKKKSESLVALNDESRMDVLAPIINRIAWFAGPTLEIPVMRKGKLRRDIITPDCSDVLIDPDDPLGSPVAAAWTWMRGGDRVIVTLDEHQKIVWPEHGENPISVEDHGVVDVNGDPAFPGTVWRFDTPIDIADWWGIHRNARLKSAAIECAFIYTMMNWTRKTQSRKQIAYFGNLERLQKVNALDPEGPLISDVRDEDPTPVFDVKDLNTPVADFIEHIQFVFRTQIEAYGVPQSAVTFDFSGGSGASSSSQPAAGLALQHERLSQLRNELIPYAREAEHSSQWKAIAVARRGGHSMAAKLPTVKDCAERLTIEWPEINRVDDPERMQRVLDWELRRGLTTDAKILRKRRPDLTDDEAKAEILAHLEVQAELNDLKASRELDPASEMLNENEKTGQTGGRPPALENEDD